MEVEARSSEGKFNLNGKTCLTKTICRERKHFEVERSRQAKLIVTEEYPIKTQDFDFVSSLEIE